MAGWLVRASVPASEGTVVFVEFRVSIADRAAATDAVRGLFEDEVQPIVVEALSQVSDDMLQALSLREGEVRAIVHGSSGSRMREGSQGPS